MLAFANTFKRFWILCLIVSIMSACAAEEKPIIKLAANALDGSQINAEIARLILKNEMKYPVEIIQLNEVEQWQSLANGIVHASLEVWPTRNVEGYRTFIESQGTVEFGGYSGAVGAIGWYIPAYVVEQYPALATWEGYRDPALTVIFDTPATSGTKGQFTAINPKWIQYNADIIQNLGLNLEVVFSGNVAESERMVTEALAQKKPILVYLWQPHHLNAEMVKVALPPYTLGCYDNAEAGGVNCDYPSDPLYKIFWSDLKIYTPPAYQMLQKFTISTSDQALMVEKIVREDKSVQAVAREWVKQNESIWQLWIP